jgi:tetratricopeptide (TPR) repeat protein
MSMIVVLGVQDDLAFAIQIYPAFRRTYVSLSFGCRRPASATICKSTAPQRLQCPAQVRRLPTVLPSTRFPRRLAELCGGFFQQAMALDPANIEAMVGLTLVDVTIGAALLSDDWSARFSAAETMANKVLSLAPNHALAHVSLSVVQMCTKRVVQGIAECERALALDHNLALAHSLIGYAKYLLGRGAETEGHVKEALRLSPRDTLAPQWMVWVGVAKLHLNADTEAVAWLRRGIEANRNYPLAHFHLAAALTLLGELDEARAAVQAGLALDPGFTIRRLRAASAWSDNPTFLAGRERQCEGLRLAGVPEG